jgi:hypothetical protein
MRAIFFFLRPQRADPRERALPLRLFEFLFVHDEVRCGGRPIPEAVFEQRILPESC